jgi:hypothetical protein
MNFLYRVHDTYSFQLSFESRIKSNPFVYLFVEN